MENLELIIFDENGQGVVNWESLEALTSAEFVDRIKSCLSTSSQYFVSHIDVDNFSVTVLINLVLEVLSIYRFDRGDSYIKHFAINKWDLVDFAKALKVGDFLVEKLK